MKMTSKRSNKSNCTVSSTLASIQNAVKIPEVKRPSKTLMEKRRRARINQSLQLLKAMIVEANTENVTRTGDSQQKYNKLERADILEITVRHFQRHTNMENPEVNKYRAGFADCAKEVSRYMATPEGLPNLNLPSITDPASRARLVKHLEECVGEIDVEISSKPPKKDSESPIVKPVVVSHLDYRKTNPYCIRNIKSRSHESDKEDDDIWIRNVNLAKLLRDPHLETNRNIKMAKERESSFEKYHSRSESEGSTTADFERLIEISKNPQFMMQPNNVY